MSRVSVKFVCLLAVVVVIQTSDAQKASSAPRIIRHPKSEKPYKLNEPVTLKCMADSESKAVYKWKKDGVELDLNNSNYQMTQGSGYLNIKNPTEADDGIYQCFASNNLGVAISMRIHLRKAAHETFPTTTEVIIVKPKVGEALKLPCSPPKSYPKASAYWGINVRRINVLEAIKNDDRVLLDYEGNLYFANVLLSDNLRTKYLCISNNAFLGAYVQGNDHLVEPREDPERRTFYEPFLMWSSPPIDIGIRGSNKTMKCIFGGLPTPVVTWRRLDGKWSNRYIMTPIGHGTEVEIANVEVEDAGIYECSAKNTESGVPVTQKIRLSVHSEPYWAAGKAPSDITVVEESNVEIDCQVHGTPKPNMTWFINGEDVNDLPNNPKVIIEGHRMKIRGITSDDDGSEIAQCMSMNEYGSILANVIITIIAEEPSFTASPVDTKVVEGEPATFQCHAQGAPKPRLTWLRGDPPRPVSGDRFNILASGDLEIKDTSKSDTDKYTCHVENKFGKDETSAELIVRGGTRILPSPAKLLVNVSEPARIECSVTTDPAEEANLKVEWLRNGDPIDYSLHTHLYMNRSDFSLRIRKSKISDTAEYKCKAGNGLDQATSDGTALTVRGRPEPPYDVRVNSCTTDQAKLSWKVGFDNNDPIVECQVYYNNSALSSDEFTATKHTAPKGGKFGMGDQLTQNLPVRPWTSYVFYVMCKNSLGTSPRSEQSKDPCQTPQVLPRKNPSGVCSKMKGPTQLVITWQAMPREEHNGEGFHYIVSYKILKSSGPTQKKQIWNAAQTELVIHDRTSFSQYEISVQAANNIGIVPIGQNDMKIGYSGEGKPTEVPRRLRLDRSSLNGTHATFLWEGVDTSIDKIKGFFRGYKIKVWKADNPDDVREEEIISGPPPNLCPPLVLDIDVEPSRRRRNSDQTVSGSTNKLWPNSKLVAGVQVLSQTQEGQLSDTIEFDTPEGVPGPISSLVITESGSSHLKVEWKPPVEPNGIITGYILAYHVSPPAVGDIKQLQIENPLQLSLKVKELDYSTHYDIRLYGVTNAGRGVPTFVQGKTLPFTAPDKPVIGKVDPGESFVNVSWVPSDKKPAENPGSEFCVEYKRKNSSTWIKTCPEDDSNWLNITNLEPGWYDFQVVATSKVGDSVKESRSTVRHVYIGPEIEVTTPIGPQKGGLVAPVHASSDWFLILIIIICFLLLLLLIVCIIKRSRGEVYPVYEKEKMWRHNPLIPDEDGFGEYTKPPPDAELNRSKGSLDNESKPLDSDSDSLGEYEDQDASKFNEDGSFIGQYAGKSRHAGDGQKGVNTFV